MCASASAVARQTASTVFRWALRLPRWVAAFPRPDGHDQGWMAPLQPMAAIRYLGVPTAVPKEPAVFDHNLIELSGAGLHVDILRPNAGTHAFTAEMKAAVLQALLRA